MNDRLYISSVLSAELKSRSAVNLFYDYFVQHSSANTIIDFSGVNFATRSFMDEFYNVFIKNHLVKIENIPSDIQVMLDIVGRTQNKRKSIKGKASIVSFSSVDELCSYVSQLSF